MDHGLTAAFDWYRARLCVSGQRWFFPTERGAQNDSGMARYTKRVSNAVIGRPITAHRFRNATATLFNRTQLTDAQKHSLLFSAGHNAQTHADYIRDDPDVLFRDQTGFHQTIIALVEQQKRENDVAQPEDDSGSEDDEGEEKSDGEGGEHPLKRRSL